MSKLALKLIKENERTRSPFLDLGNCGMESLPMELLKLYWLEELNLGTRYWNQAQKVWNSCKNNAGINKLKSSSLAKLIKLPSLKALYLSSNQINSIRFLKNFDRLVRLDLSSNQISDVIPLAKLTDLVLLDLKNNQISDVSFLNNLTNLVSINLSFNQISDIRFLEKYSKLTALSIFSNEITTVRFADKFAGFRFIELSGNMINDYNLLSNLIQLKDLDIVSSQISDISFLEKLTKLVSLNLSFNQITDIRPLKNLTHLMSLNLSSNRISDVSPLKKLANLEMLRLSFNRINDVSFLKWYLGLRSLSIVRNEINTIQFEKMISRLQVLELSGNMINDYNPLSNLIQLKDLDIVSSQISDISFLEKLTKLVSLNLSFNQITDIRPLKNLTHLMSLNLSSNRISDVSPLEKLVDLKSLDLSYNRINDVSFLKSLTKIRLLNLSRNEIKLITEETIQLWTQVERLYLESNPIENIPKDIYSQSSNIVLRIISNYFSSLKKGVAESNEVKLIIVGNTTAGKTSLVQFLQEGVYEDTQNSTHGISLKRWEVRNIQSPLDVNVWDFGGQEYYHATHRLFLDDRAVYVVVWEGKTNVQGVHETVIYLSDQRFTMPLEHFPYSYWLASIRYYAPESTILILQTKIDKIGNEPQAVDKLYFDPPYSVHYPPFQLSVKSTNSNRGDNTKISWQEFKAFETKLVSLLQNDAARYPLGAKWVEIRDKIREFPKDFGWLYLDDFIRFCRQIDKTIEVEALMVYLGGSASTILHYKDDAKLSRIVFLNPQWVSDTIYNILSFDIQEKHKGEFTHEHVEQVLAEKGMAPAMADTFLELMKAHRFELIFEKPNANRIYIAPQYLPEQYDEKALEFFRPVSSLRFTLHFPYFMPRSIFLRFMVRYGEQAKYIYWKHGFIAYKGDVRIVAECFFSERKITVSIDNKSSGTAQLLAQELFSALWEISDKKMDITVSSNEVDFIEIGLLERCVLYSRNVEVESTKKKLIPVSGLSYLFGKYNAESVIPIKTMTANKIDSPENSPEVFFSYAWGKVDEEREKTINALYDDLKEHGYKVVRDKMDLGYKGLISGFMKRIGKGNIIILALSDKYLKSSYCMFELYEAFRNSKLEREDFIKSIFPIRTEPIDLSPKGRSIYREHWKAQQKEWTNYIKKYPEEISASEHAEYERIKEIVINLGKLFEILTDINALTVELLSQNNFAEMKRAIDGRIQGLKNYDTNY